MDKDEQLRLLGLHLGEAFQVEYNDILDTIDIWMDSGPIVNTTFIARYTYESNDGMLQIIKKAFNAYKVFIPAP